MNSSKNFVRGVMNKDLDDRLLPDGIYRHAVNINVSSSDDENAGTAQNHLGNTEKMNVNTLLTAEGFTSQGDNIFAIGSFTDTKNSAIYWFLTSNDYDLVVRYYESDAGVVTGKLILVESISTGIMNFSRQYLITGINIVENLLFFTDGLNPPRRLDVTKVYRNATISEDTVNVIVKPPLSSPALELINDPTDTANNLEDKFIRFAYRYRYVNGEISALSPFSKTAFEAKEFSFDYATGRNVSMQNNANSVNITVELGSSEVRFVDIIMKDARNLNAMVVTSIDKSTISSTATTFQYKFKNNKIYTVLPDAQLNRLFDNVPRTAKAQELIGNIMLYGNYKQFYNIKKITGEDIVMDFELNTKESPITAGTPTPTFKSGRDYEAGIVYLDDFGRMSTVLESKVHVDNINIPITNGSKKNDLKLNIYNPAPEFASKYRVFLKQNKGKYYNIIPISVVNDGLFVYLQIAKYDIDKVKEGDYIYIKSTPSGIKQDSNKYKVIEAEVKPKDFLGDKVGQLQDEGFYIKIKVANAGYFSESSIYTLKQQNNGRNSKEKQDSTLNSRGDAVFLDKLNSTAVEAPIHYGDGDNKSLSSISSSNLYTFDTDRRFVIEITGANTFSWRDYNVQWYYGENVTMNADTLPASFFNGANGNYLTANIGGNNITFGIISWDTASPYTIGDSFRLNYRGSRYGIFGTPNDFAYDTNKYWSGAYTAFPDLGGSITDNPGDLQITPGTVIEIQVIDGFEQEMQRFISSSSYENIEEWFFEERVFDKYKQYMTNGKSDGSKAVFFRRGIYTQYNPSGGGGGTQAKIIYTNDPRGYMMMCVKGYDNSSKKDDQKEIRVNFSIRIPDNYTILETEGVAIADDVYYELPGTYPILGNRRHGKLLAADQDQGTFTPAVITLEDFNAVAFGNGMESSIIEDDWNGPMLLPSPRASASIENYKEMDAGEFLTYSGAYDVTSGVNALNQFNLSQKNFKQLHKEFGSIQKLYARNGDVVVFQEDKVSKVLFDKNLISSANGGGVISNSKEVLGTQIPYDAEFGISSNPESFAQWGNDVYFTDQKRGSVLKMTDGVGISEISAAGMKSWFRELFSDYPDTQKLGAFDPNEFMYVLSSNEAKVASCMSSVSINDISLSGDALTNAFLFRLFANRGWSITKVSTGSGTGWLTLNQTTGNGGASIGGTLTSNVGAGASRSMIIRVTACGANTDITITQSNKARKDVVVVSLGDKGNDGAKLVAPKYNYGSGDVGFGEVPIYAGSEYTFNPKSGLVGLDGIPSVASTVNIIAAAGFGTNSNPIKAFNPNLGNKMYYLDTNTEYDPSQGATLISAATEVPSYSLVSGEYKGNFTYNATNSFLYMIVDYTNVLDMGDSVSAIPVPKNGLPESININNANVLGNYTVSITSTSTNIRMTVENELGAVLGDTGYLSTPSSVSLDIKKSTSGAHVVKIYNTITAGSPTYALTIGSVALSSASIRTVGFATAALACASSGSNQTIYFDGAGATPVQGDIVYVDSLGAALFEGGLLYYKVGTNSIAINDQGLVTDLVSCVCGESAVPVIQQIDIEMTQGTEVAFVIKATKNPYSYAASGNCRDFTLFGGQGGAVFSGQDCITGLRKNVFVGVNQTISKCFWIDSVYALISSDGAYFLDVGGCTETTIPPGLVFDPTKGTISGIPTQQGQYTFTVVATNCIGTSTPVSFKMIVGPETPATTAFNVDTDNPEATSSLACAIVSPAYTVLYHDGMLSYPVIVDTVYEDELGTILFDGGGLWYTTALGIAIKVDTDGTVLDTYQCGVGAVAPAPPSWVSVGPLARNVDSALSACGATPSGAYWRLGTFGVNPGKLSTDPDGLAYAPAGWYKSGANSYYWDGSQWTSVTACP